MRLITTSWDDGHELDFKLAELLDKYNLPATFYIPKNNTERPVMSEAQVQQLAKYFEIGGHTINHTRLYTKDNRVLDSEIEGSFKWLSNLLGYHPVSFCFPGGVFHKAALATVYRAGFKVARSAELLAVKLSGTPLLPTTLQVYNHTRFTYLKHLIKRKRWENLMRWMCSYSETNLIKLAEYYLNRISKSGGCFHLWGHSWEIELFSQWKKLEALFNVIANRSEFTYIQNRQIINYK